jgi:mersacidin/lichenicidin family type 2 lantibiotic
MCQLRKDHAHSSLKSRLNVIRAKRDEEYRSSLSDAERATLPSPAGAIELDDADLGLATGGLITGTCGCSGGCSHHCAALFNPGLFVSNPIIVGR